MHSLAVGLFLRKEEVRYFDEIGMWQIRPAPLTTQAMSTRRSSTAR